MIRDLKPHNLSHFYYFHHSLRIFNKEERVYRVFMSTYKQIYKFSMYTHLQIKLMFSARKRAKTLKSSSFALL